MKDLEFDQNYGWVRQGKGKKDRLFIVAWMIKAELIQWIDENELVGEDYLFFSYQKGLRMSTRTVYEIVKTAAKKAKITKNVHPHTLRHSFATHLIQQGNSVMEVQPLLGHNSINTTMRYVHMASPHLLNVRSPLDLLG